MLDYIDVSAIGAREVVLYAVILWLGWYTWSQTKRWLFASVLTLALLFGTSYLTGVVADHHLGKLSDAAGGSLDAAGTSAKLIGDQAHTTSAGGGAVVNKAYKKNMESEAEERDF